MTTQSTHSPLPWHIGMKPGPMIYGEQGEQIADMRNPLLFDHESKANAHLIVHRVNTYEVLVTALELAVGELETLDEAWNLDPSQPSFALQSARQALALARNTEGTPSL